MALLLAQQFVVEGPPIVLKVIGDTPFYQSPEFWIHTLLDLAVAGGTIGLAWVTWSLVQRTAELANDARLARKDAAKQLKQDDLHHRQELTGIVVLKDAQVKYDAESLNEVTGEGTKSYIEHRLIITATAVNPCAGGPALSASVNLAVPNLLVSQGQAIGTFIAGQSENVRIIIGGTIRRPVTGSDLRDCKITVSHKNIFNEYRVTEYVSYEFMDESELAKPKRFFLELPIDMDNISQEPMGTY